MLPFRPPSARATKAIVVVCVAVQVALTLSGAAGWIGRAAADCALIPAAITGHVASGAVPAWATLFTSLFVHAGWLHLGLNMVMLIWLGRQVEWVVGTPRLLALFLVGGAVGGLAQVAADPHSIVPVVGASGGISTLFAVYVVLFARNPVQARRLGPLTLPPALLTTLWYAAAWTLLQLLTAVAFRAPGDPAIAIWAHIGGFLAGLAFAHIWRARVSPPPA